jgi:cytochrome c553
MKKYLILAIVAAFLGFGLFSISSERPKAQTQPANAAQVVTKIPEVIILGSDAKLGKVTFNHVKHNGGEYSADGAGPIACVSCHHTAQPAAELVKFPGLQTVWPANRTTTLTAELFNKDPRAAGVAACRDCHARVGQTPKLMPAIPSVKQPGATTLLTMTNQMAFHKNCDVCHFEVNIQRPGTKVPDATKCNSCHKRAT